MAFLVEMKWTCDVKKTEDEKFIVCESECVHLITRMDMFSYLAFNIML